MWIEYKNLPVRVVGASEFDLRRVLRPGDRVSFEAFFVKRLNIRGMPQREFILKEGNVEKVYRYHALVRMADRRLAGANRCGIIRMNRYVGRPEKGKRQGFPAYEAVLDVPADLPKACGSAAM